MQFEKKRGDLVTRDELIETIKSIMRDENDLRRINLVYHALRVFYELKEEKVPIRMKNGRILREEWELRKMFYLWVQREFGGFIPMQFREKTIMMFCSEYGVEPDILERILAGSILRGHKLARVTHSIPAPVDIIDVASFLLIEKTLCISDSAEVVFFDVERKGTFIKDLLFRSKRFGLILDFQFRNNNLTCRLSGPFQIFKHPSPIYGEGISNALIGSLCRHKNWSLKAIVRYHKKRYVFEIDSNNTYMRSMKPTWVIRGYRKEPPLFDSSLERRLYSLLARLFKECEVLRESDIVESPDGRLFIPDFTVRKGNKSVYIELVGFWTEKYAKKKKEKLDSIYYGGIRNLIAIVDNKLAKYFRDAPYRTIFYDKMFTNVRALRNYVYEFL